MQKFYGKRKAKPKAKNSVFVETKIYLPRETARKMHALAEEMQIPMSRLIAIAVDNELDAPVPFTYEEPTPTKPYVEYAFQDEAGRVLNYMRYFATGVTVQTLLLSRFELKMTRETMMYAIRELLEVGMIEKFKPAKTRFQYAADHERLRLAKDLLDPVELKSRAQKPERLEDDV